MPVGITFVIDMGTFPEFWVKAVGDDRYPVVEYLYIVYQGAQAPALGLEVIVAQYMQVLFRCGL